MADANDRETPDEAVEKSDKAGDAVAEEPATAEAATAEEPAPIEAADVAPNGYDPQVFSSSKGSDGGDKNAASEPTIAAAAIEQVRRLKPAKTPSFWRWSGKPDDSSGRPHRKVHFDPRTGEPRRRFRQMILPRTILGVTAMLVAFAIGASLSGVVLYAYYEYKLDNTQDQVSQYIDGFDQRYRTASESIDATTQNAQASVQKELEPLRQFQAEGGTLASLTDKVKNSVWFVSTLDDTGAPSVGTAFIVASSDDSSVLVGSYNTIKAATRSPGPEITLMKGDQKYKATLNNWVEDKDLAVMTIPKGELPKLDWVAQNQPPKVGERAFVATGLGSAGASVTQGFVSDVSTNALQHDAAVGVSAQGAPLINSDGKVTGIASTTYSPFGFMSPSGISFAVPIRVSCEKLLTCPADANSATGSASR